MTTNRNAKWNEQPGRDKDSERVRVAWEMATQLIKDAAQSLHELDLEIEEEKNSKQYRDKKNANTKNLWLRKKIAQSNPA